jgi:hypothetical protein
MTVFASSLTNIFVPSSASFKNSSFFSIRNSLGLETYAYNLSLITSSIKHNCEFLSYVDLYLNKTVSWSQKISFISSLRLCAPMMKWVLLGHIIALSRKNSISSAEVDS